MNRSGADGALGETGPEENPGFDPSVESAPELSAESEPTLEVGSTESPSKAGLGGVVEASLSGERVSARGLLDAIGGWRGIAETFIPATVYLVLFILTRDARLSVIAPLVLAVAAFVWRLFRREPVQAALSGLLGVVVCVAVTLFTGRGETYYLPGFWINGAWIAAHTISLLVGWPLIGLLLGFLRGSLTAWRRERPLFRAAQLCTVVWIAVFAARLAVQLPLYFAASEGDASAIDALGLARLFMGIPLFALAILFTWLVLGRVVKMVDDAAKHESDASTIDDPLRSSDES